MSVTEHWIRKKKPLASHLISFTLCGMILWMTIFIEKMQLITGQVTQKYLERGVRNTYGSPSEYNYVKRNDFSVDFIMTKAEEARIITHYQDALEMKHQFVLRLVDGNWLLDEKFYGFEDEETWYLDSL